MYFDIFDSLLCFVPIFVCFESILVFEKYFYEKFFLSITTFSGFCFVKLLNFHYREMLEAGEDIATCPSCSLIVRVIYDPDVFIKLETVESQPIKEILAD